jgi:kynurenine 3-monooxygenase
MTQRVDIVGAGPAGLVLALLLAKRGHAVRVFERRPDPRATPADSGRSINLALAARGMRALQAAGALTALRAHCIPMPGRMLHGDAAPQFIPYGQRPHEVIYSLARSILHEQLASLAAATPGIELQFEWRCVGLQLRDGDSSLLSIRNEASGATQEVESPCIVAADGARSAVREALLASGAVRVREQRLAHDYQEFTLPAHAGGYALEPHALHIWPRGGYMLIALPNTDGSFTATLFLPEQGPTSFASLAAGAPDGSQMREFFAREFPDVAPLLPQLEQESRAHPRGALGTVYCEPWQLQGRVLLIGDAAHAIVPFHGQGMNCALEDCLLFDALLQETLVAGGSVAQACAAFEARRRPDTDAIAQMALENYLEMRDSVRDPRWQQQKTLALELERRFPERFVPRYSMVMFHAEIGYADALTRGATQQRILDELTAGSSSGEPDWALAARLVTQALAPLPAPA